MARRICTSYEDSSLPSCLWFESPKDAPTRLIIGNVALMVGDSLVLNKGTDRPVLCRFTVVNETYGITSDLSLITETLNFFLNIYFYTYHNHNYYPFESQNYKHNKINKINMKQLKLTFTQTLTRLRPQPP